MSWLKEKGVTSVGALGHCWGVWALSKAAASEVPLKCGVGPHPSTKVESLAFGGDEKAMLSQVRMPLLLLPAGNDGATYKPGGEIANILASYGGSTHDYPDMAHGWTTRGDLRD